MSIKSQQPAFDRGQSYIRSQTSVADSEYIRRGDQTPKDDLPSPKRSDSRCFEEIYDTIIQQMSGVTFKEVMDAVATIERGLKGMQKREATSIEIIKREIQASYQILHRLSQDIAGQIVPCIHREANLYQEPDEAAIKHWLESFPG